MQSVCEVIINLNVFVLCFYLFLFFNHEYLVGDRWIALWRTLKYIYLRWIAGDGWQRRKAQADAPETESWDGWTLRLHVFPSPGYPSVPFVLAFAVSKTDVPETDVPETDVPETDVPETKGVLLFFFNIVESFSGSYCLIIFEWSGCVVG